MKDFEITDESIEETLQFIEYVQKEIIGKLPENLELEKCDKLKKLVNKSLKYNEKFQTSI